MNQKKKNGYLPAIVLFVLFLVYTVLVATVGRQAIGPNGSEVGFASFNGAVFSALGQSSLWYNISKVIGVIAIVAALLFAVIGVLQLIRRKSVAKVDGSLVALGVTYILMVLFYVLFEFLVINYRPVLMDGQLEASYPSSHTMLVICIMGTALVLFHTQILNKSMRTVLEVICAVFMVLMVVGRLLSGVHWATDIIGGILLGAALVAFYKGLSTSLNYSRMKRRF